ncbi:MAG: glycoside hydrolase family protein, partial [Candidatus Omnitrophica bacterium]|nr:glycoside hydrolase family protein [Candidatus Omnitrophota bacterium]
DEIDLESDPQKQKAMRFEAYYSFIQELTQEIHALDPNHPVALGNGELIGLDYAKEFCPDVDLVACIIYRGKTFGNLFRSLRATFDKPILLSEFGADSYDAYKNLEDQNMQAFFLESQWRQIYENLATNKEGEGNCLGGTIFEWIDEWWKHNESDPASWHVHDTGAGWSNGSYYFDIKAKDNKNMNEEWFGIVAISPEEEFGINKRIPKKAYYVIREFCKNPQVTPKRKGKK